VTWVTHSPEVVPRSAVDLVLGLDAASVLRLTATEFDLVINLDKDPEACALAALIPARARRGFVLAGGVPAPADANAEGKFLTGIFDDVSKANKKSYVAEIFEIAGFPYAGEEYILDRPPARAWSLAGPRPRIGLNTGCGGRWVSRLWPEENWIALARDLRARGAARPRTRRISASRARAAPNMPVTFRSLRSSIWSARPISWSPR
jgi:heptosyltransferase-2